MTMKLREPMKLSEQTTSLLKNFSAINQSLLFKSGNKIRTISVMKNIFAEATINENIPKDFGIYDLSQFLQGLSIHNDPEIVFENSSYLLIKGGGQTSKYYFSDPSVIVCPPEKTLTLPSEDVCFEIASDKLEKLLKAGNVYDLPDLSAVGDGNRISLVVRDKDNSTSNEFSIDVGETNSVFSLNFKSENIKILPGTYEVVMCPQMAKFTNKNVDLTYFIALEPDSSIES